MKFKHCVLFMKHKIVFKKGVGYYCSRCGKTKAECSKDGEKYNEKC